MIDRPVELSSLRRKGSFHEKMMDVPDHRKNGFRNNGNLSNDNDSLLTDRFASRIHEIDPRLAARRHLSPAPDKSKQIVHERAHSRKIRRRNPIIRWNSRRVRQKSLPLRSLLLWIRMFWFSCSISSIESCHQNRRRMKSESQHMLLG